MQTLLSEGANKYIDEHYNKLNSRKRFKEGDNVFFLDFSCTSPGIIEDDDIEKGRDYYIVNGCTLHSLEIFSTSYEANLHAAIKQLTCADKRVTTILNSK